jgi:hypothetical protein
MHKLYSCTSFEGFATNSRLGANSLHGAMPNICHVEIKTATCTVAIGAPRLRKVEVLHHYFFLSDLSLRVTIQYPSHHITNINNAEAELLANIPGANIPGAQRPKQ